MQLPTIYAICPDSDKASGGVKQLYRHVDILNRNGIRAFILHKKKGFRAGLFPNSTPVAYSSRIFRELEPRKKPSKRLIFSSFKRLILFFVTGIFSWQWLKDLWFGFTIPDVVLERNDILVVPETYGRNIARGAKGYKKVIFNQNAHYSFIGHSLNEKDLETPYRSPEVLATLVASEQSVDYLRYAFPQHCVHRIHYGFDTSIFGYHANKTKQIAFMTRKLRIDVEQVINLLKFKGSLGDFRLAPIDNMKEEEVARTLKDSMIFLSFSEREGFGMPPAEAMACGCVVIGYHGFGGREFFRDEFCYPVPEGDVLCFAKTVEKAIQDYYRNPAQFSAKGRAAAEYIEATYSLGREEEEVVGFWKLLAERHGFILREREAEGRAGKERAYEGVVRVESGKV